ncbi:helix-turn-helix domain-containing protein [Flexivirga sp. B27]
MQQPTRTIAELAQLSGWSERYLRAAVRSELGHSPGSLLRLLRFQRSWATARPGDLAATAARSGYADQAHLTREWRRYLGMPPAAYFALEEFVPA